MPRTTDQGGSTSKDSDDSSQFAVSNVMGNFFNLGLKVPGHYKGLTSFLRSVTGEEFRHVPRQVS